MLNRLEALQKTWTSTRAAAQASNAPGTIPQQIQAVLIAIENAQASLQAHSSDLLELQSRSAAAAGKCESVLAQIAQAQTQAVGGLLVRDRPPIWNADLWSHARTALPGRIREIADGCRADIHEYLSDFAKGTPLSRRPVRDPDPVALCGAASSPSMGSVRRAHFVSLRGVRPPLCRGPD